MLNRTMTFICLVIILLLFTVQIAFATNDFQPVRVIASNQGYTVTDSISDAFTILLGNGVKIQHRIFGTTIVMGNNVEIENDIDGDLIVVGKSIVLRGKVDGNLYAASEALTIYNAVIRDAFLFGRNIMLEESSVFQRDAFLFGENANVFGEIKRDAVAYAKNYCLDGKIGRNLSVSAENVTVTSESTVKGEAPGLLDKFADILAAETGKAAGFGTITLIGVPIACILLLFTLIGIPLSILLGIAYAVLLYLAFFVSASAFGIVIFKKVLKQEDLHKNIWYLLSGVFVLKLLTMLPFVGWIFGFASVLFGFGLVLLLLLRIRKKQTA